MNDNIPHGSKNFSSKLTEKQAWEIRFSSQGMNQKALCEKYEVGETAIANILHGRTWKHVTKDFYDD